MDTEVLHLLKNSGLKKEILESKVIPHLNRIGVKTLEDLEYITEEDIDSIG